MPARFAIPLNFALCKLINGDNDDVSWFRGKEHKLSKLHYYSQQELTTDKFWSEWFPPGKISGISDIPLMGDPFEDVMQESLRIRNTNGIANEQAYHFSPQYRIVISKEKTINRIRRKS